MAEVPVGIYNESGLEYPRYAIEGDSGMDIRSSRDLMLAPGATELIPTGLYFDIPKGYELQVRPRSGQSLKTKFRVANSPGTIDSNYTGELKIIADNIGEHEHYIRTGDRICQIVLQQVPVMKLVAYTSKEELLKAKETLRGSAGFGSTGA